MKDVMDWVSFGLGFAACVVMQALLRLGGWVLWRAWDWVCSS